MVLEDPDQGWAEVPQGRGRGVGPSPDASTGKGCKGAKDGKGGAEAPRLHGGPRAVRSRRALL